MSYPSQVGRIGTKEDPNTKTNGCSGRKMTGPEEVGRRSFNLYNSNGIYIIAMASDLIAMASTLVAMASDLLAMTSTLVAMASNLT